MKKIKIAMVVAAFVGMLSMLSTVFMQPALAMICPSGSIRSSANNLAECNVNADEEGKGLMPTIQTIINLALAVLGIVAVIIIIVGGVTYTTSQGDPAKITKAKNTIMYGVIGLVVALLAFAIVNFVLSNIWGSDTTDTTDTTTKTTESK